MKVTTFLCHFTATVVHKQHSFGSSISSQHEDWTSSAPIDFFKRGNNCVILIMCLINVFSARFWEIFHEGFSCYFIKFLFQFTDSETDIFGLNIHLCCFSSVVSDEIVITKNNYCLIKVTVCERQSK